MKQLSIGQTVYYARIMPTVGLYEILEIKIRTVDDTYFAGTEKRSKHAYLFGHSSIGKYVFKDRKQALDLVKEAEKNKKEISDEVYYEED
jgi:hypothetical protein